MPRPFRTLLPFLFLLPLTVAVGQTTDYPETRRGDVVDDYHGTEVADPYRWLEDLDSEETSAWVAAQNAFTSGYLEAIPERDAIYRRLEELWDYEKYSVPFARGERLFYRKNDGLQDQSVLYVQDGSGEPRTLLDPNTLSDDGTVALTTTAVSDDGGLMAYGTSESGSDWRTFYVRNIETGEDLSDELKWIKFSGAAWTKDGEGFFYSRYDEPAEGEAMEGTNQSQKLYYHHLGTPQSEDELVYERPDDPELGFSAGVSDDGRYLLIYVWQGTDRRNRLYVKDLTEAGSEVVRLLDEFDASYAPIEVVENELYVLTDLEAPNQRVVAIDLENPERESWREIIPETDAVLQNVQVAGGRLVVEALVDVASRLTVHDLDGEQLREIELPALGSVGGVSGQTGSDTLYYSFTSFTYPTTIYQHDLSTGETSVLRAPEVDFDASAYETKQVFYESKDGTRVPMFIVHKKDLALDGQNPTYLYGYGGFNISLTPSFSTTTLAWLEMGGIYAQPSLRGGGEYGEAWHEAGMLENKQNVFDDFIAAAEYLIDENYTSTPKLAIGGGSNGGLLVGAVMTQRPELIGAAVPAVGVLDMLRYHTFTIGWAWASEYGRSDDPEQFEVLYAYSPLHNIEEGTPYPATLVKTSDHDDRVVPGHSYKFAAALQAAQGGEAPILIRIETKAGHGAGKPTSKIIEEQADTWAFLVHALEADVDVPGSRIEVGELRYDRATVERNPQLWWARALGDVNGDGLMDVIAQNNNGFGGWLAWYEAHDGGRRWTRHIVAERTPGDTLFAAGDLDAGDIDGDGDVDLLGIEHPGEWQDADAPATIYWYENPSWEARRIGEVPDAVKDVNLVDFNADGKLDLAVMTFEESTLTIFRQDAPGDWAKVYGEHVTNLHEGMDACDLDVDGDVDLAANGYWFESPGGDLAGDWTTHVIDERWLNQEGDWSRNATKVLCRDLNGDGRPEVFMSHSERAGYPVAYYTSDDPASGNWTMHTVADELPAAHTLQLADLDGDGDLDVFAGVNKHRAVNIDVDTFPVVAYLNGGDHETWTPLVLTEDGIYNGQVADLEGDGDMDLFRLPTHDAGAFEVLINQAK